MISELLRPGSRVLCAVSGGADSMALLHRLRQREDFSVCAAHYEHGLRGEESLRDAAFVEDYCRARDIPCLVGHGDVKGYAQERGLGIEEAARELRYAFLERAADALGCAAAGWTGCGASRPGGDGSCVRCWTRPAPRSKPT